MKKIMKTKMNKKGFTLAELLIVVAIIAILIAIMVPVFGNASKKAVLERDAANVRAKYAELVTDEMVADDFDGTVEIQKTDLDAVLSDKCEITVTAADGSTPGKIKISYKDTDLYEEFETDSDVTVKNATSGGTGSGN